MSDDLVWQLRKERISQLFNQQQNTKQRKTASERKEKIFRNPIRKAIMVM
jgi:hypothetical protein